MNHYAVSIGLLLCSNVFMTFAWYAHLKILSDRPWLIAAFVSWGIALFYLREKLTLNYLWAGLCLAGAAFFPFRDRMAA